MHLHRQPVLCSIMGSITILFLFFPFLTPCQSSILLGSTVEGLDQLELPEITIASPASLPASFSRLQSTTEILLPGSGPGSEPGFNSIGGGHSGDLIDESDSFYEAPQQERPHDHHDYCRHTGDQGYHQLNSSEIFNFLRWNCTLDDVSFLL